MRSTREGVLFFATVLAGILAVLAFRSFNPSDGALGGARLEETLTQRSDLYREMQALKDEEELLMARIVQFQEGYPSAQERLTMLEEELDTHHRLLGVLPVTGPGIQLILEDGEQDPELEPGAIENWFKIIHNNDMLRVLNELLIHGAEAIEINGERLTPQSEVYCSWAFITINGRKLPAPYVIRVVGDSAKLMYHVNSTGTHLFLMRHRGIRVTVEAMEAVRLEASHLPRVPQHLRPME